VYVRGKGRKARLTHTRRVGVPVPWVAREAITSTVVHGGLIWIVLNGITKGGHTGRFKLQRSFTEGWAGNEPSTCRVYIPTGHEHW
jgi:hypothetical protein